MQEDHVFKLQENEQILKTSECPHVEPLWCLEIRAHRLLCFSYRLQGGGGVLICPPSTLKPWYGHIIPPPQRGEAMFVKMWQSEHGNSPRPLLPPTPPTPRPPPPHGLIQN